MVVGISSFELLIYFLFKDHQADWEKAGQPPGFGQSGIPTRLDSWLFARHRLQKHMLFRIPPWVETDALAYRVLIIYKISIVLFFTGAVGFMIFALLSS
jgi:hypothetical protein